MTDIKLHVTGQIIGHNVIRTSLVLGLQLKLLESQRPTQQLSTFRGTVPDVLEWVVVTNHRDLGPKHNIAERIQSPNDRIGLAFNGRPGTLGSRELVASKGQWVFYLSWSNCPKVAPTATPLASVCKTNGSPTLGMRNT